MGLRYARAVSPPERSWLRTHKRRILLLSHRPRHNQDRTRFEGRGRSHGHHVIVAVWQVNTRICEVRLEGCVGVSESILPVPGIERIQE